MMGLGAAAPMLLGMGLPRMANARQSAQRVACMSNMRQIAMACNMYAADNKGKLPDKLGALTQYLQAPQVFLCPRLGQKVPADVQSARDKWAGWVDEHSDYVYLGAGQKLAAIRQPAQTIILYDKPGNHGGGNVNLAFADGHCESVPAARAMQMIEKQKKGDQPDGGGL
jgi:prepilin-type processing-associated H-X9-DG protein